MGTVVCWRLLEYYCVGDYWNITVWGTIGILLCGDHWNITVWGTIWILLCGGLLEYYCVGDYWNIIVWGAIRISLCRGLLEYYYVGRYDWSYGNFTVKTVIQKVKLLFIGPVLFICRPQWPSGLRHLLSLAARKLGSWVRIPLQAWMCVRVFLCCFILCR
jgi:hypothetical protein